MSKKANAAAWPRVIVKLPGKTHDWYKAGASSSDEAVDEDEPLRDRQTDAVRWFLSRLRAAKDAGSADVRFAVAPRIGSTVNVVIDPKVYDDARKAATRNGVSIRLLVYNAVVGYYDHKKKPA